MEPVHSPLVSVIIPVYNGAKYLEETVRSVLSQTVTDMEVLVVNDESKDQSAAIVTKLAAEDNRVRLINKKNSGVADTRNTGISQARGKYIALLDQDDVWCETNLEEKIRAIENGTAKWAFSDIFYIDADGKELTKKEEFITTDFYKNLLKWENVIPAPSGNIVAQRGFLGQDIRYDRMIPYPSDRDFCVQLARKGDPVFVNKKLWKYRVHGESMSAVNKRISLEMGMMYKKYIRNGFFPDRRTKKEALARVYLMIAGICIRFTKERWRGLKYMFKSFLVSPSYFLHNMLKKVQL